MVEKKEKKIGGAIKNNIKKITTKKNAKAKKDLIEDLENVIEKMESESNNRAEEVRIKNDILKKEKDKIRNKISCLLNFSVSNYKSIADKLEVKFNNNKDDKSEIENIFAIMGKNASGKSNIVKSLLLFWDIVSKGDLIVLPEDSDIFFKLQENYYEKPIRFSFEFMIEDNKYGYLLDIFRNFDAKNKDDKYKIASEMLVKNGEWLIDRGKKFINYEQLSQNELFKHVLKNEYDGDENKFKEKIIDNALNKNKLIFSKIRSYCNEILDIYINFIDKFVFDLNIEKRMDAYENSSDIITELLNNKNMKKFVLDNLAKLDNNVYDLKLKQDKVSRDAFFDLDTDQKREYIGGAAKFNKEVGKFEHYLLDIKTLHKTNKDNNVFFNINEENTGLSVMIIILITIYDIINKGGIFVIDEIEASLQYSIMEFFIFSFYDDDKIIKNKGQIIFVTHNALILTSLAVDNIWIVDKEHQGTIIENLREKINSYTTLDENDEDFRYKLLEEYFNGYLGGTPRISNLSY
jgi:AAA15 family ATPase/GTPase